MSAAVIQDIVASYYRRSRVDYFMLFAQLYISYNAWYRDITGAINDREALRQLRRRFVIWDDYLQRRTLHSLDMYVDRIAELTEEFPLYGSKEWSGVVQNRDDWRGLIRFWYRVRCDLLHGSLSDTIPHHREYVRLAYISLSLFMGEIISRMSYSLDEAELRRLNELQQLSRIAPLSTQQQSEQEWLVWRYIHAPKLSEVDMTRVRENTPLLKSYKRV